MTYIYKGIDKKVCFSKYMLEANKLEQILQALDILYRLRILQGGLWLSLKDGIGEGRFLASLDMRCRLHQGLWGGALVGPHWERLL